MLNVSIYLSLFISFFSIANAAAQVIKADFDGDGVQDIASRKHNERSGLSTIYADLSSIDGDDPVVVSHVGNKATEVIISVVGPGEHEAACSQGLGLTCPIGRDGVTIDSPAIGILYPEASFRIIHWDKDRGRFVAAQQVIKADFDGDGVQDIALLKHNERSGLSTIYADLSSIDGDDLAIVFHLRNEARVIKISVARPGEYQTACSKGYGPVCPIGRDKVTIDSPAIGVSYPEASYRIIYWDGDRGLFDEVWLTD